MITCGRVKQQKPLRTKQRAAITTETHSQFIALRARGCSLCKIAGGASVPVSRGLRGTGPLTRELKRINAELDKRDYTNEPTWVLVNRQNMILSRLDKVC